jgi:hypothetical protein
VAHETLWLLPLLSRLPRPQRLELQGHRGTAIDTTGSDRGLLVKALDRIKQNDGKVPKAVLADGGYFASPDIEWTHAHNPAITTCVPPTTSKHGIDPCLPRIQPSNTAINTTTGSQILR